MGKVLRPESVVFRGVRYAGDLDLAATYRRPASGRPFVSQGSPSIRGAYV